MTTGTEEYYRERALEYDRVYLKPERQGDLHLMREWLAQLLAGRRVIEVAAGTGYWTDAIAGSALTVLPTDVNVETLQVAENRRTWPESVKFVEADAFSLDSVNGNFDAALAGFFWSHIPIPGLDEFVDGLFHRIEPGAQVVLLDNRYGDDNSHPVTRTDDDGNTYQTRSLEGGRSYEVLKNFPTVEFLRTKLEPFATDISMMEWEFYWAVTCTVSL